MSTMAFLGKDVCRIIAEYVQTPVNVDITFLECFPETTSFTIQNLLYNRDFNISCIEEDYTLTFTHNGPDYAQGFLNLDLICCQYSCIAHPIGFYLNGWLDGSELFFVGPCGKEYYVHCHGWRTDINFTPKLWTDEPHGLVDLMVPPIPRIKNQT